MSDLATADGGDRLFCTFRTEGRLYGIDAAQVREVSAHVACTPVPQAPPAIRGLTNLRSRVYLVVDARPILGLAPAACSADSRLIVLKPHLAENFGVLVEHGGDIVRVSASRIEAAPPPVEAAADAAVRRTTDVVVGVCKLDTELMNIVDSTKLLELLASLMDERPAP